MKVKYLIMLILFFNAISVNLSAFPKPVVWTVTNPNVVQPGSVELILADFFTLFNEKGRGEVFPTIIGANYGFFKCRNVSVDGGIDYFGGTDDPLYFNAKAGVSENILFNHAPALSVGIYGVGTKTSGLGRTNFNIVSIVAGKTVPDPIGGFLSVGFNSGSSVMGKDTKTISCSYFRGFCETKYCDDTSYSKFYFLADYFSGKNLFGGGGFAGGYSFTPSIYFATGPIWFNDKTLRGKSKWVFSIVADFPVCPKK